jgi:hypothetical protein
MTDLNRRTFVKLAGAGAGAGLTVGAGAVGAQQQPGAEQEVVASFSASINDGKLTMDGSSLGDPNAAINIDISTLDGSIEIEGDVYDDKTWDSQNIQFPDVDPSKLIDEDDLPDFVDSVEFDDSAQVDVVVDSISGAYDPDSGDSGLVTGNLDMLIDADVTGQAVVSGLDVDFSFKFSIDVNDGEDIKLTTEQSNNLEGIAANLESNNASATVVNNNFTVPEATGPDLCQDPPLVDPICINEQLGLPITDPERNWVELTMEPNWDGDPPQFGLPTLPGGDGQPQDHDGDGLFEDVTGTGEVTVFDTQTLFDNLDNDVLQENAESFNFNSFTPDDEVTILDVASHWKQNIYD